MIYLDNAATTKMFEGAVQEYQKYACERFYNASAGYQPAVDNAKALQSARMAIIKKLGVSKGDVLFTSGATESNNLAICGSARAGKWQYVFSGGEHPSVYNTALHLREQGNIVHIVPLLKSGEIDYDALEKVVCEKTRLISCMHVSNETGAINDIARIVQIRDRLAPRALIHVDGVQSFCKIPSERWIENVDFFSISAHKFHGPKGVGALYVKNKEALKSIVFGGGQEFGKRSGTENLPGIMAMKYALEHIDVGQNYQKTAALKKAFLSVFGGQSGVNYIDAKSPYILSMTFEGVNGETLMRALENEVIIGTGSACSSSHVGNRVLEQIGYDKERAKHSVRISFDAYMSEDEVAKAAKIILDKYHEILEKVK